MPMKLMWLAGFLALYVVVCLCIAIYCARRANEISSSILSVIGFSSLAFAGWLVIGYPAGIYSNGLAFGTTAFAPLVMGFAAAMFYERLNWLSRHYKLETPGELFAQYFHSELVRVPIALVALASAVPFLVAVFKASGELLYLLTE